MFFTIYKRQACIYCERAIALLNDVGISYQTEIPSSGVVAKMKEITNHSTYPFIYKNGDFESGEFVGGFSELNKLIELEDDEF